MTDSTTNAPSQSDDVDALLLNGLRHFSRGDVDAANEAWNQVVEMEPNNETATDYLTNSMIAMEADRDPAEAMTSAAAVLSAHEDALENVRELHEVIVDLTKTGKLEEALVLLQHACEEVESGEDQFGRVRQLVQNLLTLRYAARLGPLRQRVLGEENRAPSDLSSEEMHVLALVDVSASEDALTMVDLLDASLHSPFLTLRALVTLRHRGLVRLQDEDGYADGGGDSRAEAGNVPPPPEPSRVAPDTATDTASDGTSDSSAGDASTDRSADADLDAGTGEAAGEAPGEPTGDLTGEHTTSTSSTSPAPSTPSEEPAEQLADEEAPGAATTGQGAGRDSAGETDSEAGDDFEELFREGVSLYVQGEFDQARERFERCIELRPDDPRPKRNLERMED